jgi:glutamate/tyrosine decarboxylase-like PLP-dependent enzyme
VQSINASGHKYGLVYPGVGWAIWRDKTSLPNDLVFDVNYLGGSMPTFALNFSRPGSEVIAEYFMFVSLGAAGYRAVQQGSSFVAQHIARGIAKIGPYRLLTEGSELPVFAFTLAPEVQNYTVFDVSARLREHGWLVPARHGRPVPGCGAQADGIARGAEHAAAAAPDRGGTHLQALTSEIAQGSTHPAGGAASMGEAELF